MRTQQAASSRRSMEARSQAKPAAEGSRLQSMAEEAATLGSRQASAPVSIPGASDTAAHHSRIHSSGDLAAMQHQDTTTQVQKVSHCHMMAQRCAVQADRDFSRRPCMHNGYP